MLNGNGKLICPEIRIENTNVCNASCEMCPRDEMTRPTSIMPMGLFMSLVDQARELGATDVSIFGFGEPLLDPTLPQKVEYCDQRGLTTHITTNGSMLRLSLTHDLLLAGLKNMRFSIHAVHPVKYMQVHKGLDWLKVHANVGNFLSLNKQKYNHSCTTHLTVIPLHGETVEDIREIWEKHFDFVEVWRPHNWGGAKEYRDPENFKKTCGRPFSGPVQVQADGRVIPCCFLTNAEIILGDTNVDALEGILTNGPYEMLRELHTSEMFKGLPCETCDQRSDDGAEVLLYSNRDSGKKLNRLSTSKCEVCD